MGVNKIKMIFNEANARMGFDKTVKVAGTMLCTGVSTAGIAGLIAYCIIPNNPEIKIEQPKIKTTKIKKENV